jgi:hypothetical protein
MKFSQVILNMVNLEGYIERCNSRPNKFSLSTGSDNRAVDIYNVANSEARFMR